MSSPDNFTITVPLGSPEMRSALNEVAQALSALESACGPSRTGGDVRVQSGKPGSKPPSGSMAAASLCRRIAHYEETNDDTRLRGDLGRIVDAIADLYLTLDPHERRAAREFRALVKLIKQRQREDDAKALAAAYPKETS